MLEEVLNEAERKMQVAIDVVKKNFATVRTGRATPALLDHVMVNYYGSQVSLKQLASVSVPEPRQLLITPYDKNAAADIEKAILTSDLGINPKREAGVIRLIMPEPSEDQRKELVKRLKKEAEEGKVAIRNVRREALESAKKAKSDKKITEDDESNLDDKIQGLTDRFTKNVDELFVAKEKEVLAV